MKTMSVKKGDKIKVEYTGSFEDGTVFDSSEKHGKPLEFEVGAGQMIKGFDDAVIGMKTGEEKEIKISAEDAYGEKKDELIQKLPKEKFSGDVEPKVGMMAYLTSPEGQEFPAQIIEVGDTTVTVDLNHPLTGKTLLFKIKLVD